MKLDDLYQKALNLEFLDVEEGMFLFEQAPLSDLMYIGDRLRQHHVPHGRVTWIIDRNVNTTNVCIANCKFCNFYRIPGMPWAPRKLHILPSWRNPPIVRYLPC